MFDPLSCLDPHQHGNAITSSNAQNFFPFMLHAITYILLQTFLKVLCHATERL